MSLNDVHELLQSIEYRPASLSLELETQRLSECLSGEARTFVWIATKKTSPGILSFKETFGHVWADDATTMATFAGLSREVKAEVLGFFTFQIHELTHHFDFLITPVGVNYHSKWFREYRAFQSFAPLLLRQGTVPGGRLVDYNPAANGRSLPSDQLRAAWKEVHDIIATL